MVCRTQGSAATIRSRRHCGRRNRHLQHYQALTATWARFTQGDTMKILVIGAGIGGLATAVALHRAGHSVEVFDRVHTLQEVGAGLTLWPNAVKALRKLGLNTFI